MLDSRYTPILVYKDTTGMTNRMFMSSILEGIKQKATKALVVMCQTNLRAEEHSVAVDLWQAIMMSDENKYLQILCACPVTMIRRTYRDPVDSRGLRTSRRVPSSPATNLAQCGT